MNREIDIQVPQLGDGHTVAYFEYLDSKEAIIFSDINQDAIFKLNRLFNFASLKSDIKRIGFFIEPYLHKLSNLLEPIGSNDDYLSVKFSIYNLKRFGSKIFLGNTAAFKTWRYSVGVINRVFNLFLGKASLIYSKISMVGVGKFHNDKDTTLQEISQGENPFLKSDGVKADKNILPSDKEFEMIPIPLKEPHIIPIQSDKNFELKKNRLLGDGADIMPLDNYSRRLEADHDAKEPVARAN